MTLPVLDCGHCSGRTVFAFYLSEEIGTLYLCQKCYDRLKGGVLQDVLNEMMAQAVKGLGRSKKYGG